LIVLIFQLVISLDQSEICLKFLSESQIGH